ncbi:hypothetical protein SCRM01_269 [Synechococcus phage S-CRM01]|uniref:hypothetical protein n=1 Tax=Synechococcus phage S-CRM01 TaxID=1026955 RepID=UPI000209E309|nr:hypothetical protein SCRM01_269 [Synechococcus phage S-CRM01]AEC53215.1 hypothetical protein SCRM01_269 [Synechococcus phage S-CRM01]
MSYEPENHLAVLEDYLQAVHLLTENGWVADGYVSFHDAVQSENYGGPDFWGHKYVKGDQTYWLNYTSVQCVLDFYQPNRAS